MVRWCWAAGLTVMFGVVKVTPRMVNVSVFAAVAEVKFSELHGDAQAPLVKLQVWGDDVLVSSVIVPELTDSPTLWLPSAAAGKRVGVPCFCVLI